MEPLSALLVALFGAGAGGAVSAVVSLIRTFRQGKIENEETLIKRLDADNQRQSALRQRAEEAQERAEKEAEGYRKQRDEALDEVARLRRKLIVEGIQDDRAP